MDQWIDGWMVRFAAQHTTALHTLVAADGVAAGTASGGGGGRGRCPLSEGSSAPASPVRDHERARTNKRKLVKSSSRSGWRDFVPHEFLTSGWASSVRAAIFWWQSLRDR